MWMENNIARDENINTIEGNDEMYDILHDVYGPQIHTEESNLGNIHLHLISKKGKIMGLLVY